MEADLSDSFFVESEILVWLIVEIEVKPVQLSVVRSGYKVITTWVKGKARVPLDS